MLENEFCRFEIDKNVRKYTKSIFVDLKSTKMLDKIRFIFRPVFSRSRGVSYDSEPTNVVQGDRGGDGGADAGAKYRWFFSYCKLQKQRGSTAVVV